MDNDKYNEQSRQRLKDIVDKKINTTMIGSLSAFEEFILKSPVFLKTLTEEQKIEFQNQYEKARAKILDLGNNAKRNLTEEFSQYDIKWNRYQLVMQVKPRGRTNEKS
jgi:hypothetical protein